MRRFSKCSAFISGIHPARGQRKIAGKNLEGDWKHFLFEILERSAAMLSVDEGGGRRRLRGITPLLTFTCSLPGGIKAETRRPLREALRCRSLSLSLSRFNLKMRSSRDKRLRLQ